jgi:hypothetical protein
MSQSSLHFAVAVLSNASLMLIPVSRIDAALVNMSVNAKLSSIAEPRLSLRIAIVSRFVYFEAYTAGICEGFIALGCRAVMMEEIPHTSDWDIVLVVGVHLYPDFPWLKGPRPLVAGIQTEQLPVLRPGRGRLRRNETRFTSVRSYYDVLFEWNPDLYAHGLGGSIFLPYGCSKQSYREDDKVYDLAFIGNVGGSYRRKALLESLASQFRFYPDFSPGFAERKAAAIAASRILLNIHFYDGCGFEAPRVFDYLSSGAFVLSEKTRQSFPFVPGVDFDTFDTPEHLVQQIKHYLDRPALCQQISRHGFETAHRYHFQDAAGVILLEAYRQMGRRHFPGTRLSRWLLGRLRCRAFELRDQISLRRRRIFGQNGE